MLTKIEKKYLTHVSVRHDGTFACLSKIDKETDRLIKWEVIVPTIVHNARTYNINIDAKFYLLFAKNEFDLSVNMDKFAGFNRIFISFWIPTLGITIKESAISSHDYKLSTTNNFWIEWK